MLSFAGSSLSVSAATVKDVFDAEYYANRYPDLKAVYGDDADALYNHYVTLGLSEGRNGSPVLDVVAYREAYADLNAAFGDDWNAYVTHFLTFGAAENRQEGVLMNPLVYGSSYSDLQATFGTDTLALVKHYLTCGISENRTEGTSFGFDSIRLLNEYEDAVAAAEDDDDDDDDEDSSSGPITVKETYEDCSYAIYTYSSKEIAEKDAQNEYRQLEDAVVYYGSDGKIKSSSEIYERSNGKLISGKTTVYDSNGYYAVYTTSKGKKTAKYYNASGNEITAFG